MALIVQKYGGTSVGDAERIKNVARRVGESRARGNRIVVVVSAMGGVTDGLIRLAGQITEAPSEREMDVLLATGEQTTTALTAMALQAIGIPAVSLTGAQAGIVTDGVHTRAKIENITPKETHRLLDAGNVVIVAGFQGQTSGGQVTTLGRGGSDLTAIALAAALKADLCQIYTDVDGVYTADPRIVSDARKLQEISYDEMLELAGSGAKVMQLRSVEIAKKFGVVFEVRSSLNDNPGTIVKEETRGMEQIVVRGVALDRNQAKITLVGVPDRPGVAAKVFRALANTSISVDMIIQNVSHGSDKPRTDLSFTVDKPDVEKARAAIDVFKADVGFDEVAIDEQIGKLSVVGVGMRTHSGVAATMFETIAKEGINIEMISTSEIKISVLVEASQGEQALRAVHEAFLGKQDRP
jgi:aspartate kinase